jgi:hypothetical protein
VQDFDAEVAKAHGLASRGEVARAVTCLRHALDLWRGSALAGLAGGQVIEAAAVRLNEQRLTATEQCLDLELRLGRHRQLVSEIGELVVANPLRERLVGQLMVALHRSGRQADALQVYRRLQAHLTDELGLEPGAELQRLQLAVLRDDLDVPSPPAATTEPDAALRSVRAPVPAELPPAVAAFTGRAGALTALDALLPGGETGTAAPAVVAAVVGAAGTGKTALTVHWAHRVRDRFPDGQLYADLRGYAPGPPVRPLEVLARFLRALGEAPDRLPTDVEEAACRYRSLLAARRVLVVLDNAADAAQARPLLPGRPGCMALVTSRDRLDSLLALEGAHRVAVGPLPAAEARQLFVRRSGRAFDGLEPRAVDEIVTRCGRLPLALAVVAARVAVGPAVPLRAYADELAAGGGLDAFDSLDAACDLRTALSWSYRRLSEPAAWMFRLLGSHADPDIDASTLAGLAGLADLSGQDARRSLAELARAHLVEESAAGRVALHVLLHAYATELSRANDGTTEHRSAVHRPPQVVRVRGSWSMNGSRTSP